MPVLLDDLYGRPRKYLNHLESVLDSHSLSSVLACCLILEVDDPLPPQTIDA